MSIDFKGQQCPVCKAYLFEEDDVVFCPECGAPHHRECYQKIGHCALSEFHGTEQEYSRIKAEEREQPEQEENKQSEQMVTCYFCYEEYPRDYKNCPHCGHLNATGMGGAGFDPLGGVPADFKLDGDVTTKEAAKFVMSSSNRYMPKFAKFKAGGKISWNWAAFLLPEGWALHRKMYKSGILAILMIVAAGILMIPFSEEYNTIISAFSGQGQLTAETYSGMLSNLVTISSGAKILSAVAVGVEVATRLFFALFGDYLYYKHTVATLRDIKENEAEDKNEQIMKRGGSNLLLLIVGLLAASYLPSLIMFIAQIF